MRLHTFNNGMTLDLDKVESVSLPVKGDGKSYGAYYYIRMTSGVAHEVYEWVWKDAPAFGNIVISKEDLLNLLNYKL